MARTETSLTSWSRVLSEQTHESGLRGRRVAVTREARHSDTATAGHRRGPSGSDCGHAGIPGVGARTTVAGFPIPVGRLILVSSVGSIQIPRLFVLPRMRRNRWQRLLRPACAWAGTPGLDTNVADRSAGCGGILVCGRQFLPQAIRGFHPRRYGRVRGLDPAAAVLTRVQLRKTRWRPAPTSESRCSPCLAAERVLSLQKASTRLRSVVGQRSQEPARTRCPKTCQSADRRSSRIADLRFDLVRTVPQ